MSYKVLFIVFWGLCQNFFPFYAQDPAEDLDWEKRLDSIEQLREDGYLKDSLALADQTLSLARKKLGEGDPLQFRALYEYAVTMHSLDQFQEAEKMVRLGLTLQDAHSNESTLETIRNLELLARIQLDSANSSSARTHLSRALEIFETIPDQSSSLEGRIFHTLALLEKSSGNYEGAFELGSRALELYSSSEEFFLSEARLSYDLGSIALEAGWVTRARELLDQCVRILETRVSRDDPRWAYAMEAMAVVLVLSGNLSSPLPLVEGAIRLHTKWFSPKHSKVVEARLLKGMLLELIGDRSGAKQELLWAVERIREIFGKQHPRLVHPLSSLSKIFGSMKKLKKGEEYWKEAYRIAKKYYDPSHPLLLNLEIDRALLLMKQARYFQAESILKTCLHSMESLHGNESSSLTRVLEPMAILYRAQDRNKEAVRLFVRISHIQKESLGIGHPDLSKTLESLTGLLYELGEVQAALKWAKTYLYELVEERGEDHQESLTRIGNLVFLAQVEGEDQTALDGYLMALRIQRKHFGAAHREVAATLFKTAGLLRKMGKTEEAERMEKEGHLINMGGNPEDKDILFPGKSVD